MSHAALLGEFVSSPGAQIFATPKFLNANYLLDTFGLAGLLVIVFAECGLLIGFFLPGDSLLFTAGLLVAGGQFDVPLWMLVVFVPVAAILGNIVGYWIGQKAGTPLFERPDSKLFKRKYIDQTHEFFEARGPFAIVAARFVPVVRTFVTVVAGVSGMNYRQFILYSAIGGVLWGSGVTLAGYFLGQIDFVAAHVEIILIAVVLVSIIPIVLEYLKARRRAKA
jgi:membrane-associated protein